MAEIRVLIAAAGRGSRAGLPYPKTLYPVMDKPILVRIVEMLAAYDAAPTIIVSPEGEKPIGKCLNDYVVKAQLVLQYKPRGMGDAVLQFEKSAAFVTAEHVLLVWGDIPFIQPETVATMVHVHLEHNNDFTFITRHVDSAYTVVVRNSDSRVSNVIETRELGVADPQAGERDIGLFIFRKNVVFAALHENLPGKLGRTTGDHGFLYIIEHLAARGCKVEALPVASELDLVSLNSLKDLNGYV